MARLGTFSFPSRSWYGRDLCFSRASVALVSASRFMRRALAPSLQLLPMGPGYPPSPKATLLQVPRSQENTSGFFITCHISAKLPISENITHRKVQDPGNQSAFYFTVHSYKFLHGQDNQVTFRSALLVTKLYNYPGFKNKMGWYTLTVISLSYCRRRYITKMKSHAFDNPVWRHIIYVKIKWFGTWEE